MVQLGGTVAARCAPLEGAGLILGALARCQDHIRGIAEQAEVGVHLVEQLHIVVGRAGNIKNL